MNFNDLSINELETIEAYDLDGSYRFTLDELQTATIANTQEKTDITGKQGRKLNSLKRNKAVVVSGTNGLVSGGLLEAQTGSKFKNEEKAPVKWSDFLTITANAATLNYVAAGTEGAEISEVIVKDANGVEVERLAQGSAVADGVFTYDPETKTLAFEAGAYADGTEIHVHYYRFIKAAVLENLSDVYSEKLQLYINAFAEDVCGVQYRIQFYIPKADFNGNFDLNFGDAQTVHAFEAESLSGAKACGGAASGGALWKYTVFGVNEGDAA